MAGKNTINKHKRKSFFNLILFLLSIIVVVSAWPREADYDWLGIAGSIIMVSSCYLVLYLFMSNFRTEILLVTRKTFFIILTILSFVLLTRIVLFLPDKDLLYLIPYAIIPIVIRTFFDARLALFILLVTLMLVGFIVPDKFIFIFMNFITGVIAIFSLSNLYRKGKIFFSATLIVISYSAIYFGESMLKADTLSGINWSDYKWFLGNGILVLLSYPIIFLFEKRFYFLSDTTLLELSDTSQPLLNRLAEEAPGSFQHSRQVANLAEEAARVVGANLLLTRVGALYHDIGKVIQSQLFIENQTTDQSPHDNLDPLESSKLIINHVNEGILIARQYKLPVQVIDFIRTHHGTTKAYFFYKKYLDTKSKTEGDEKHFEYPGPRPFSKELAIVMMADAVEASSRTLDKYTEYTISELVDRIIYIQEQDDQFSDAPLTFKDISDIKGAFKKRLGNIYHARIVYPERDLELN